MIFEWHGKGKQKHGAPIHGGFEWHPNHRARPSKTKPKKDKTMDKEKTKEILLRIKNNLKDFFSETDSYDKNIMDTIDKMMEKLKNENEADARREWFNNIAKSFKGEPEEFGEGEEFIMCLGICGNSSICTLIGNPFNLAAFLLANKNGEIVAEFLSKSLRVYELLKKSKETIIN